MLFQHASRTPSFVELKTAFEQHWVQHHGKPEVLRVDPRGAWRSKAAEAYLSQEHIEVGEIPAEAHWKIGLVEVSIRIIKDMLTALAKEFPDKPVDELFAKTLWAINSRAVYNGFSPLQHATGRSPDECGRLFKSSIEGIPVYAQQHSDSGFEDNQKIMLIAETEFLKAQARQRLLRAQQAGHRSQKHYSPGDLVFYWRLTVGKGDGAQPFRKGKFVGPARVLAVETKQTQDGLEPADVVWLHRSGRLIRSTPRQLRPASSREIVFEQLKGPLQVPWNIASIMKDPRKQLYDDITTDAPQLLEYERSWDDAPPLRRHRTKRPADRVPLPERDQEADNDMDDLLVQEQHQAFWSSEDACIDMEFGFPESRRATKQLLRDPVAFVVNQLKRKQVEVKEKSLTASQRQEFAESKDKEVRNFIRESCLEALPEHLQPPKDVAMRMRWLLVWKWDENNQQKAKARIVIQGYQDPLYEFREVSAPVVSRAGRQCFLQVCAQQKFRVSKGDVTGAFLQGDVCTDKHMWCIPVQELCEAMRIPKGSVCRLRKAAYGLVQAPLLWYNSISGYLENLGFRRLVCDPCIWTYHDENGVLRAVTCGHVDDFMFGGNSHDDVYKKLVESIKQRFRWGSWENGSFVQCGTKITQNHDYGFELSQDMYLENVHEISLNRDKTRKPDLETTDQEKSQMRSVLGALSWYCGQVGYMYSADVNILLSQIPRSTIADVMILNKLIYQIKNDKDFKLLIHAFPKNQELHVVGWCDAAWANRPDGSSSTAGILIGMSSVELIEGKQTPVSIISWRSSKIDRTCQGHQRRKLEWNVMMTFSL